MLIVYPQLNDSDGVLTTAQCYSVYCKCWRFVNTESSEGLAVDLVVAADELMR